MFSNDLHIFIDYRRFKKQKKSLSYPLRYMNDNKRDNWNMKDSGRNQVGFDGFVMDFERDYNRIIIGEF